MPRAYGITNAAPYASAPAVGLAGDTYFNTTEKVLYVSDGTAWSKADTWTVSGTTVTPTDAAKTVAAAPIGNAVQWGVGTIKHRLLSFAGGDGGLYTNANATGVVDDASKAQWRILSASTGDLTTIDRSPPGATAAWATRLALDSTGQLTLPGSSPSGDQAQLRLGTRTVKGRVAAYPGFDWMGILVNCWYDGAAWHADDTTKPAYRVVMNPGADTTTVERQAPTTQTITAVFSIDGAGNLIILGPNATKSAGTVWINPSDRRLKKNVTDYGAGLAQILALRPIRFEYNGLGGTTDGQIGYGFLADEVAPVMPEMVGTQPAKLHPEDEAPTDLQTLDTTTVQLALINAVRELTARVAELETALAASPQH